MEKQLDLLLFVFSKREEIRETQICSYSRARATPWTSRSPHQGLDFHLERGKTGQEEIERLWNNLWQDLELEIQISGQDLKGGGVWDHFL